MHHNPSQEVESSRNKKNVRKKYHKNSKNKINLAVSNTSSSSSSSSCRRFFKS